jgi:predicted DNA-binding antitoxin AbrB/MazE fold protein
MDQTIPAIFDSGVFRPLQPVDLADGTQVQIQLPQPKPEFSAEDLARQQAGVATFLEEMASLPPEGPDDGFSGRDHDKILYGAT